MKKPAKGGRPAPQAAAEQGTTSPAKRKWETWVEMKERRWRPGSKRPDVYTRSAHWSPPQPTGIPRIKKNMLVVLSSIYLKKKKYSQILYNRELKKRDEKKILVPENISTCD